MHHWTQESFQNLAGTWKKNVPPECNVAIALYWTAVYSIEFQVVCLIVFSCIYMQ